MAVVVDASVALKWVVEENGSQEARNLVKSETLVAPDLLFAECANALWVMVRRKLTTSAAAFVAMSAIEATSIRVVSSRPHASAALRIAFEIDQPVYDCLYLAIALSEKTTFVTADSSFLKAAQAHATYSRSVSALQP